MFCPKCAAKNEIEQKFCRRCGQSLETIALVLKGNFDEAMSGYDEGYDWLINGLVSFAIALFIASLVYFFAAASIAVIIIGIGLVVSLPMVFKGIWQIESASKLLETEEDSKLLAPAAEAEKLPPASFTTDSLIPPSVTERTTRDLIHQNEINSGDNG